MLIVTMNDIPGYRVTAVLGEVMGVTVRSRNVFSQMGAGFKSMAGGELKGMTENLFQARMEATNRMVEEAVRRNANAVIALRYSASSIGDTWTELCCYGTAAMIEPIGQGDAATPQSAQDAAQRQSLGQAGYQAPAPAQPMAPGQPT
ncbi:MAG: YbjQ family protein [Micrococcales bacterium]|nr:YbjQ family protein [Micrococcales bacterium]